MSIYVLERHQRIDAPLDVCWGFFSDPRNLPRITPEWLRFEVLSDLPGEMYPGLMIRYRVSPLPGWRTQWLTEITHVNPGSYFVDEQRVGPYRVWHHEHWFESKPDGTVLMTDRVHYALPALPGAAVAERLLVRPRLREIFDFRQRVVAALFQGNRLPAARQAS